ncbi:DUF1648 domain-containing protein [Ureibacillus acetophenoni]|uniref:Uncharacterized protein DUF1648 n=1 Tax=Ureibacillus acetophenoni TaxID=614649 RepID=A0A285U2B5_9BACL|nr:DUF1648 domain-containing protein [Ureibacillus acetophenoni]SOC36074.1 uncharacterized protein DUF1648 [Ureibacillus acetophenoni]
MSNPYRPELKLSKTKLERIFDLVGIGVFLLSLIFALINWPQLPDKIPGHFNALGEVDRWGSKYEIIILPIIGLFIFTLMTFFEKAPHMHNYPKRLNESNVEQFYLNSRMILNMTKNSCLIIFGLLIVQVIRVAKGEIESLGGWVSSNVPFTSIYSVNFRFI